MLCVLVFYVSLKKPKHFIMSVIHFLQPELTGNSFIIAKTSCGRDVDSVGDFDTRLKYVTCKHCIKKSIKEKEG